ncbi:MAG: ribonuclease P protein component [Deltaproteobacteria bacterium]|jgi:ribonuclease P protein component|nr:ribonuclease P protein component [Deltaproteobacteria bacterium]
MNDEKHCFSKSSRIIKPEDFLKVKTDGVSARTRVLVVSCLPGRTRRLGIVVSRKVGNAVQRNRLKRITREFFRIKRKTFPSGDNVVIMSHAASRLDNAQVRAELSKTLCKLEGLLNEIR